jgi:hypothetical protein
MADCADAPVGDASRIALRGAATRDPIVAAVGMVNFEIAAAEGYSRIDAPHDDANFGIARLGARTGEPLYCRRAFMLEFPA